MTQRDENRAMYAGAIVAMKEAFVTAEEALAAWAETVGKLKGPPPEEEAPAAKAE